MAPIQLPQPALDILDTVKDGVDTSDTSTIQSISNTRPDQNSTGTGLMQLSAEVRMRIIDLFLDTDVLVMEAKINGEPWARCRESIEVPELWRPFEALMMTCRQLRLECLDILGQRTIYQFSSDPYTMLPPQLRAVGRGKTKVWFQNRVGDFIWEMPRLMGLEFLLPIRLFELEMHSTYHKQDRRRFPVLLSVLCDHMPNLLSFRFKTSHSDDSQRINPRKTRDTADVTLDQQIRRTLLRLGSFLVHRHQNLDLIKFGQSHKYDFTYTSVNIMARRFAFQVVQPSTAWGTHLKAGNETMVLNATKIRRYCWAELAHVDTAPLALPQDSPTSEIDEGHAHFSVVDLHAYRTKEQRTAWGFRHFSTDDLIGFCKARITGNMDARSTFFWNGTQNTQQAGSVAHPQVSYSGMPPFKAGPGVKDCDCCGNYSCALAATASMSYWRSDSQYQELQQWNGESERWTRKLEPGSLMDFLSGVCTCFSPGVHHSELW